MNKLFSPGEIFSLLSKKRQTVERRVSLSSTFKAFFGFTLFTAVRGVCGRPHAHR